MTMTDIVLPPTTRLAKDLSQAEYVRERCAPRRGDQFYLHLVDLLQALQPLATDEPISILDFGCGGSPYRMLFPKATYQRADIPGDPSLDYIIDEDGTFSAPDGAFDLVLSTQVLEHLLHPSSYIRECVRVLKPGGRLVLTTHGMFEEHGCPHDYRRWTADGLQAELQSGGLLDIQVQKITVGGRACLFYLGHWGAMMCEVSQTGWQAILKKVWSLWRHSLAAQHWIADHFYGHQRVCPAIQNSSPLYVALLAIARKKVES